MKVLFFVTHLLGTGHLARTMVLARALHLEGHAATVVSGGMPAPHLGKDGVSLVQLEPLRSDGVNFTRLLDAAGEVATPDLFAQRERDALAALHDIAPDVVVTELFPFGRRVLRAEFTAILRAAQCMETPPLICASIRDILAPPSKPEKATATENLISAFYDAVLVHADPAVTPLDISWPVTPALAEKLQYTGFVAPPPASENRTSRRAGSVLVTAGGGSVGMDLFHTALAAAEQTHDLNWRVLVGGEDAQARISALRATAPPNVTIETVRSDFREMLYHTNASVSMCGYNTALDILQSGCPAVFVPFDAGGETEQRTRATALAHLDGIDIVLNEALNAEQLVTALRSVMAAKERSYIRSGMDGAAETSSLLERLRSAMT